MKKFILLIVVLASCWSCKKDKDENDIITLCDAAYCIDLVIKNETDKEIVMTNKYPENINRKNEIIAPGQKYNEFSFVELGPCDNRVLLEDVFPEDAFRFYGTNIETSVFRMTVGGKEISDDIWFRKYWSYTPDYYVWTYTLTVTDELLAKLPTE